MRLALLLALAALGCTASQTEGDFMYLRSDGADLPVWVRGNVKSKTLVVWLSGGPGSPVAIVRGHATDRMEEHFGMVYWDQRGAGSAQGNPAPETFTMAEFVKDTEKVVTLVRTKYGPTSVFLLGHSWGGTLGVAYLLDSERRAGIRGFLDVAGNHDMPLIYPMKLAWLESYAEGRIEQGSDVAHWTKVRDFCASNPPLTEANFQQWDEYTDGSTAAFHDPDQGIDIGFELLVLSPDSLPAYQFVNQDLDDEYIFHDDTVRNSFSFSSRMKDITLPTALLWGTEDGIVPLPARDSAFEALGTPAADIHVSEFSQSAHFSFLEEPDAFADAAIEFVDTYR